jgi:thiamine biosynthesis lipoprotein
MWRLIFLFFFPISISAQLKRFQFSENKMGSPFNLVFYHSDSAEAAQIAIACFKRVDSLNAIFSDYDSTSEIKRLVKFANQPQKVSDELFDMIMRSETAWKKSNKTFDITLGALTQLWRKARTENRFPDKTEIKKAKRSTGFQNLIPDKKSKTILCKTTGMSFDFGGIVKGHAAQMVIDLLKTKNITSALADAGGDIAMSDAPPGKKGWNIGINIPESEDELWDQYLELKNCAVATSGDVYRFTVLDGKKYSHIIDPRTGYGVTSQRNVTVIAKEGTTADWLATACSILPIKKALTLAQNENAAILIATLKDEKIITYKTTDFCNYLKNESIQK